MSVTSTARSAVGPRPAPRRVRHQALESLLLMAFSAAASCAVATALLLLAGLGR